jgi:predicted ATP-dependent endonuclease of OLD family
LASLEPFLQPELNESFFCSKLVLVEGPEDKALLHAALTTKGSLKEFARAGAHVVSASGKGSLINMIALARGFKTPLFLMFDADTDCDAGDREKSRVLNEKLARLLGKDTAKYAWPAEDIFDHDSIVWKANIQEAINLEHVSWYDEVRAICAAFGWRYDRLKKNPIVVSRAFEIATQSGKTIKCLDRAADSVLKFALS